jgi:hypothetical protein
LQLKYAAVIERMHLRRIRKATALLVDDQGVVFPTVPKAKHDLHELIGTVVAQIMRQMLGAAEIGGFRTVERRHDVPGRTTFRHEVEGSEQAGHVERFVIGGGIGDPQAEPAGDGTDHRDDRNRIHLDHPHAVRHGVAIVVVEDVRQGQPIIEERKMELALLHHPPKALEVFRRGEIHGACRMAPGPGSDRAVLRLQKPHHFHLPLRIGHCFLHLRNRLLN